MVYHSEIRRIFPYVAFYFAHLGAFLGSSSDLCPRFGDFVQGDSSLGLVLVDLYPLQRQFLDWFGSMREALKREVMGSEVRSSNFETSLSSSADTVGAEIDIAIKAKVIFSIHGYQASTPWKAWLM